MVDISKLAFDSGYRYERVALKSNIGFSLAAFPAPGATQTVTVNHNLGYKPYVKAWYSYGSGKTFDLFAGPASFDIDSNSTQIDNSFVTTSTFVITLVNFGGSPVTGTIYYRIYAEPQV